MLPLYYGMLSKEDKKKTAAHLARIVRENDYHIATGFPGTPYILFALADNGYEEDAFKMLMTDTCPSWLYEMKVGGTTIWERWDALREDGTCKGMMTEPEEWFPLTIFHTVQSEISCTGGSPESRC